MARTPAEESYRVDTLQATLQLNFGINSEVSSGLTRGDVLESQLQLIKDGVVTGQFDQIDNTEQDATALALFAKFLWIIDESKLPPYLAVPIVVTINGQDATDYYNANQDLIERLLRPDGMRTEAEMLAFLGRS